MRHIATKPGFEAMLGMQEKGKAASQQEPKPGSYFGGSADRMEDLPALPKADSAAGAPHSTGNTVWPTLTCHSCLARLHGCQQSYLGVLLASGLH